MPVTVEKPQTVATQIHTAARQGAVYELGSLLAMAIGLLKGLLPAVLPILVWTANILSAGEILTIGAVRDKAVAGASRLVRLEFERAVGL